MSVSTYSVIYDLVHVCCFRIYEFSKVRQRCDGTDVAIVCIGTGKLIYHSNTMTVAIFVRNIIILLYNLMFLLRQ